VGHCSYAGYIGVKEPHTDRGDRDYEDKEEGVFVALIMVNRPL
jgi:hypothetical protein